MKENTATRFLYFERFSSTTKIVAMSFFDVHSDTRAREILDTVSFLSL